MNTIDFGSFILGMFTAVAFAVIGVVLLLYAYKVSVKYNKQTQQKTQKKQLLND